MVWRCESYVAARKLCCRAKVMVLRAKAMDFLLAGCKCTNRGLRSMYLRGSFFIMCRVGDLMGRIGDVQGGVMGGQNDHDHFDLFFNCFQQLDLLANIVLLALLVNLANQANLTYLSQLDHILPTPLPVSIKNSPFHREKRAALF